MFSIRLGMLAACTAVAACGGGGQGSGSFGTGQAQLGRLHLLATVPADATVQVDPQAPIRMRFDAPMVLDCTLDEETWLREAGTTTNVTGTWSLQEGGRALEFAPAQPLQPETDYDVQLGPLTCDQAGRILEVAERFTFRTIDNRAPTVLSADVLPNETGRSRTAPLVVTFAEAIAAGSVTANTVVLRDPFGQRLPCVRTVTGATLTVTPLADLPGDRQLQLQVGTNVTDRAGNALAGVWSVLFRTAPDAVAPTTTSLWPGANATNVSPLVQPIVTFSESVDPATVEPSSVLFQDEFGSLVAFAVESSADQRTLRVRPLQPLHGGRNYVLAFLVSGAAVTDVSGNGLATTQALSFRTGHDATPPALVTAVPGAGATRVSINARPALTFDEPLDPAWLDDDRVQLRHAGEVVPALLDQPTPTTIRLTPVLPLAPSGVHELWLRGGHDGIRDLAGNILAADLTTSFTVAADGTLPGAMLQPGDGAVSVPTAAAISIVFDSVLDAGTVSAAAFELRTDDGQRLDTDLALLPGDRAVRLTPTMPLAPDQYFRTWVRGGPNGVREASGNWLASDLNARFRTSSTVDVTAPAVTATINSLDSARRTGVVVPPAGFTVDVTANDGSQVPDMGSVEIELTGPDGAAAPTTATLTGQATIAFRTWRALVPADQQLAVGTWTLQARVRDLSGNLGVSAPVAFSVVEPDAGTVPFERTQVVWARTDLDRDGNGRFDFDDDLVRLGLQTPGDPRGTNAYVRRVVLDAILATANTLFGRGPNGQPLDADSVALRFTSRQPIGIGHLQIALGGLDPEGPRGRGFGAATTGVLGRAFFDARNQNHNDRDIATSPGLGVFPAEMFLYQADIHRQVWPAFQTMWAQRFLSLCPDLGGTPAGSGQYDDTVLQADFDPLLAPSVQAARWHAVMRAIDDWCVVIGTVLAHEVGHAVGLVAPGPAPSGLFGDGTLHNSGGSAAEVMAPAVGYEAIVTLTYRFRDFDLAYLRHRILQR